MSTSYNLNFMHPQYGTTLNVDIDGSFTVQEVLEQLRLSGFMGQADLDYDLELMGKALERQTMFMQVPELYDGAVLRLVAQPDPTPQASAPTLVLLHLKHPTEPFLLSVELPTEAPLTQLLTRAVARGFVPSPAAQLYLTKGAAILDSQQTAAQNGLQSGDYLQLHQRPVDAPDSEAEQAPPTPVVTLADLQAQLQALQAQLEGQDQMAPLPQPELETVFQPLEELVQSLRGSAAPLTPIEPAPARGWWGLLGVLVLVALGLAVAFGMGWL